MAYKPLVVQSDRTMLLESGADNSEECRSAIIPFSELVKSPEHIHTYQLSSLSIWNAASAGLTAEDILSAIGKYSRYPLPDVVIHFIKDTMSRYGAIRIREFDENEYLLECRSSAFADAIRKNNTLSLYLKDNDERTFTFNKLMRGTIKLDLMKLGLPVEDLIPLKRGEKVDLSLRDTFTVRHYQKESVDAFLSDFKPGTGYGCIVLPCGSGKTIVGMIAMAKLKCATLILVPSVAAVHQWIRELIDKTTLDADEIGEYSGERKEIRKVTICTYQSLLWREDPIEGKLPNFELFSSYDWGFIIYDEVHMLPAPVFRISAELQSIYRLGLTATLIREDGRQGDVFSLVGPKRYDVPWSELEGQGFIAKAYCHEVRIRLPQNLEIEYATAPLRKKYSIAAMNPDKLDVAMDLIAAHPDDHILIIGQYIEQLEYFQKRLGYPMITGRTSNKKRDELYDDFRSGKERILIVSKVANFAIDLPDASMAIQLSGTFGSRQEEAQRLGRILRPKQRDSHFYTIITRFSAEEEYAMNRQKFLCEQGYSYSVEDR